MSSKWIGLHLCFTIRNGSSFNYGLPDEHFTFSKSQNPWTDASELHKFPRSPDFEVLKLRNDPSSKDGHCFSIGLKSLRDNRRNLCFYLTVERRFRFYMGTKFLSVLKETILFIYLKEKSYFKGRMLQTSVLSMTVTKHFFQASDKNHSFLYAVIHMAASLFNSALPYAFQKRKSLEPPVRPLFLCLCCCCYFSVTPFFLLSFSVATGRSIYPFHSLLAPFFDFSKGSPFSSSLSLSLL